MYVLISFRRWIPQFEFLTSKCAICVLLTHITYVRYLSMSAQTHTQGMKRNPCVLFGVLLPPLKPHSMFLKLVVKTTSILEINLRAKAKMAASILRGGEKEQHGQIQYLPHRFWFLSTLTACKLMNYRAAAAVSH